MARQTGTPEGRILRYFRTAPLDIVGVVLALIKDVITERQARSDQAKDKAKRPAAAKSHHKKAAVAAAPPAAPKHRRKRRSRAEMAAARGNGAVVEQF